jgi:voltage-gated potassium channel
MDRRLVRRTLFVASVLSVTVCVGTIGFSLIEHWGVFDAFYMTLTTITTVGYQEVRPLSRTGRIFNSFVIFFGVTAMFFAVGALTQTIIELEFAERYGRKRRNRMVSQLHNHFVVCGFGRVGRNASYDVKVIVLALRGSDGRMIFNPPADTSIEAGDFLIVLGDKQNLNELERVLTPA